MLLAMASRFHVILCCLFLTSMISGNQNTDLELGSYHTKIDESIVRAIDGFEHEQEEKMKAGFTSDVKRSYKKTK